MTEDTVLPVLKFEKYGEATFVFSNHGIDLFSLRVEIKSNTFNFLKMNTVIIKSARKK